MTIHFNKTAYLKIMVTIQIVTTDEPTVVFTIKIFLIIIIIFKSIFSILRQLFTTHKSLLIRSHRYEVHSTSRQWFAFKTKSISQITFSAIVVHINIYRVR